jgi:hypothetical protein
MPEPTENSLSPDERLQRRRTNPRVVAAMLVALFVFLIIPGVISIWYAFSPGLTVASRLLFLALAACSLFLPVWAAWVSCHRKWKTGSWRPSPEERRQLRAKSATKKFPTWVDPVIAASNVFLAAVYVFLAVHDDSVLWYALSALWIVIALQSLWRFYRKFQKPTSAA